MLMLLTFLLSFQIKWGRPHTDTQRSVPTASAHLSTINVVQDEVQFVGRLEGEVKAHQKRVFHVLQENIPLRHNMLFLEKGQWRFSGKFQLGTKIPV